MTKILTRRSTLLSLGAAMGLAGCNNTVFTGNRELGAEIDEGGFGDPTRWNIGVQNGDIDYSRFLAQRFANEVQNTITFAFNSAELDGQAHAILDQQAAFIRNFPEVRFSVYGHTDAVGSRGYNHRLGQRRARAVVDYFVSQGISRSRLQALVSLGETQPVVATDMEERRNRRTVTEVTGFVETNDMVIDGRYAEIVYRGYRGGAAQ